MSNNFPAVPTDFVLAQVMYQVTFPSVQPKSPFTGVGIAMGGGLNNLGGLGYVQYVFTTPGSFGTFDQTTAETAVKKIITDVCQLFADLSGQTLAQEQAGVTVKRLWTWTDAGGNQANYSDTLVYP